MEGSHVKDHTFQINEAKQQFLYPFLLQQGKVESLVDELLANDFIFFDITKDSLNDKFYGGTTINHQNLETYFMPNIEPILFPSSSDKKKSLRRFSKSMKKRCSFQAKHLELDFVIESIDVILCPFHIGLLNIRITLPTGVTNNDIGYFGDLFSYLVPSGNEEKEIKLIYEHEEFTQVNDFISKKLIDCFQDYIDQETPALKSYGGSLPFYKDERMYVMSYIQTTEEKEISKMDLYRINQLNGYQADGSLYIGTSNPDYVERFYEKHIYDRWAPNTYYIVTDHHFSCLTREKGQLSEEITRQMYSEYFYTLLLIFYFKLVLLKLSYNYSKTEFEKDHLEIEILTMMINEFSAKYYLPEFTSKQTGSEMATLIISIFEVEKLHDKVTDTLSTLFQDEEKLKDKRLNFLLQIITFYTVISGIYGMNLVIENLSGDIKWSEFSNLSIFEWTAVFITLTGIILSAVMSYYFIRRWLIERKDYSDRIY